MVHAALVRAVRYFDGWLPNGPNPPKWGEQLAELHRIAERAGRDPENLTGAIYLTLSLDDRADRAAENVGTFLERYYGRPAEVLKKEHTYYAGPAAGLAEWLAAYGEVGVSHFVLRFVGNPDPQLEAVANVRAMLGW